MNKLTEEEYGKKMIDNIKMISKEDQAEFDELIEEKKEDYIKMISKEYKDANQG